MGANAQTAVPVFTAGQVLTAQQQTEINTGIPVFATTVTRDAAFGGAGEKTLAEGQFAYIEATNTTQYYDGAAWQAVGASGLTLISSTTIGTTVSSVTVSNAFSSTYDAYFITVIGGIASGPFSRNLGLQLGSTTTGYYSGMSRVIYSSAASNNLSDNNAANFARVGICTTNTISANITLINPFATKFTFLQANYVEVDTANGAGNVSGFLNNSTSYTAFTLAPSFDTITGGTIRVYGYANS